MFGIAAQRKDNGNIIVVSPDEGIEFEVNETILNIHMIELGHFCWLEVENNKPVAFSRDEDGIENVTVEVKQTNRNEISITGVVGELVKKLSVTYKTKEFGDVVCRDGDKGTPGTTYKLIISRFPDSERTGLYSRFVWEAVSVGTATPPSKPVAVQKAQQTTKNNKITQKSTGNKNNNNSESLTKYINAFVTGNSGTNWYATCNLVYPGNDGILRCNNKKKKLSVGVWVKIPFSDSDFARFFPNKQNPKTERFFSQNFEIIETPINYSVEIVGKGMEIAVKNVKLGKNHKKGDSIEDLYFGTIADVDRNLPNGKCQVDILIRRRKVFETSDGKKATFFVHDVRRVGQIEETQSDKESVEGESSMPPTFPSTQVNPIGPPLLPSPFFTPFPHHPPIPFGMTPPSPMMPYGYQMMPFPTPIKKEAVKPSENPPKTIQGKGFKPTMVAKRALVTSIRPPNSKSSGSVAFLWLLDDHVQSIFYTSPSDEIQPGHFFEGQFEIAVGKWVCKKYVQSLGKLMDGIIVNGSVELQITVFTYDPIGPDRKNPETRHNFIGKIIDKQERLPSDCSGGVRISTRLGYLTERAEWCWIVTRIFQSKHIQLLTEFQKAWVKPEIRQKIRLKCPTNFDKVSGLLDTTTEGRIIHAQKLLNSNVPKEKTEDNGPFGWTTVVDGDFVRLMVFPRAEGQDIKEMKKNVTDKNVHQSIEKLEVNHVYRLKMNDSGEIVEMSECDQPFSASKDGTIEFRFVCDDRILITRNVGLVEPIGMPKWIGKLMFCCPDRPIARNRVLLKSKFRIMDAEDTFVDDEIVSDEGTCFLNIGPAEKLSNQNYDEVVTGEAEDVRKNQNPFRSKLLNMPREKVYEHFTEVCRILRNSDIKEALKNADVDVEELLKLQVSAR